MEEFEITKENEELLTVEEVKFIFEQAEKAFKETEEQSNNIVQRTTTLITLIAGVLIAIIAYAIKRWNDDKKFDIMLTAATASIIYLIWLCYRLIKNIEGKDYYSLGSHPKKLMINDFFKTKNENTRMKWYYLAEIDRYATKIDFNKSVNLTRWKLYNRHLYEVILSSIIIGIIYVITAFIFHVFQ